ncbi:MAG: abortive infection system toxin AbiGii family protein [Candidatus Scatosoma sp.]
MFNAFTQGKGMFCKQLSAYENISYNGDRFNLSIWEHAKALEDNFNVSFRIPSKGITNAETERIEELYQLLVVGIPLRDKRNYDAFSITIGKNNDVDKEKGEELFLVFTQEVKERLLSAKIHYYTVNGLYNAELSEIETVATGYKVTLTPVKDKKMYIAKKAISEEKQIDDETIKSQLESEIKFAKNIYEIIQEQ